MALSASTLRELDAALVARSVREGFLLLDNLQAAFEALTPDDPLAPSYLLHLAQWVDLGYNSRPLLEVLLARFDGLPRSGITLAEFVRLRMVEAYLALSSEDAVGAIATLAGVLALQAEFAEPYLTLMAHFWKGRAHRQKGEYEHAGEHILAARQAAEELYAPRLIAVIQIHESWLLFQRGQRKEAMRLLDASERELQSSGHALSLGNIESARGRFVRRNGEYARALGHFERAIALYAEALPNHSNLARTLVNAAYVKRLIALDLKYRTRDGRARGAHHDRFLTLCREALDLLEQAGEIYARNHHQGGSGTVLVNAGQLHLDSGDIDHASEEAAKAFTLGEEKRDFILMARARVLEAGIANAQLEEQLGEPEDLGASANLAVERADEAIALAEHTQNNRLLASACIARGSTAANEFFADWDTARHFAERASALLGQDDRDHLSKELLALRSKVLRATGIEDTLRSWSDGITGNKTFQQITEEFAEIVIPKVWVREERNITRVAERLSISPKKVRRILRNLHLLR
jgi:tetratricopeptide (TPR) repeat protein